MPGVVGRSGARVGAREEGRRRREAREAPVPRAGRRRGGAAVRDAAACFRVAGDQASCRTRRARRSSSARRSTRTTAPHQVRLVHALNVSDLATAQKETVVLCGPSPKGRAGRTCSGRRTSIEAAVEARQKAGAVTLSPRAPSPPPGPLSEGGGGVVALVLASRRVRWVEPRRQGEGRPRAGEERARRATSSSIAGSRSRTSGI